MIIHFSDRYSNMAKSLVPSGVRIQDLAELRVARETLWKVWGVWSSDTGRRGECPWPQPVSLQRADLARVCELSDHYHVALKADGVRFLLLLTTRAEMPVALMFDAGLRPYEVSVWGPYELFERGTIIDGELVRQAGTGALTYQAFDTVVMAGNCVDELPYQQRLTILRDRIQLPDRTWTNRR
jgi:hypothetical protein